MGRARGRTIRGMDGRYGLLIAVGGCGIAVAACGGGKAGVEAGDADTSLDAAASDATLDAGNVDAGNVDGDAGSPADAGGRPDGDTGVDETDASSDAGSGDAAPPDADVRDASTGDGGACPCIESAIDWGYVGGFVAYQGRSTVDACRDYGYERTSFGVDAGMQTCGNAVPCSSAEKVDMTDLRDALAHEDVVDAFDAAPVLYGADQRPLDAPLFTATRGGDTVQIGTPCTGGGSGCRSIPPGVTALRDLLATLEEERLAEENCASMFSQTGP